MMDCGYDFDNCDEDDVKKLFDVLTIDQDKREHELMQELGWDREKLTDVLFWTERMNVFDVNVNFLVREDDPENPEMQIRVRRKFDFWNLTRNEWRRGGYNYILGRLHPAEAAV